MDCLLQTHKKKGDSNPKIALLNALRKTSLTQTGRRKEGAGISDKMFIVCWSPALIHMKLLSSAKNDTVLCFYVKLENPPKTVQLPED